MSRAISGRFARWEPRGRPWKADPSRRESIRLVRSEWGFLIGDSLNRKSPIENRKCLAEPHLHVPGQLPTILATDQAELGDHARMADLDFHGGNAGGSFFR